MDKSQATDIPNEAEDEDFISLGRGRRSLSLSLPPLPALYLMYEDDRGRVRRRECSVSLPVHEAAYDLVTCECGRSTCLAKVSQFKKIKQRILQGRTGIKVLSSSVSLTIE